MKILLVMLSLFIVNLANAEVLSVCFSPKGNCKNNIIKLIDITEHTLRIAIFSLTSKEIADAIISAKKRTVDVKIIMDNDQTESNYSQFKYLSENKIPIQIDTSSSYMHDKYIVSDDKYVLTGSYNFSKNAEYSNFENMMIVNDEIAITGYTKDFDTMWSKF